MKIQYEMNKSVLTEGMIQHFKHKGKFWYYAWLVIALFMLYFGVSLLYSQADKGLGIFCCLCSTIFFFRHKIAIWKSVRRSFHGKPISQEIIMEVSDQSLSIVSPDARGKAQWSSFIDATITERGILLYTQKNIFKWIPKSPVEGGTWEEFTTLFLSNISSAQDKT